MMKSRIKVNFRKRSSSKDEITWDDLNRIAQRVIKAANLAVMLHAREEANSASDRISKGNGAA